MRNFDLPKILPGLDLKTNSNFLLFGPGGTGKSTLAKFIAKVANAELVHIEVRHVFSKYHGESEALLGQQFDMASSRAENAQNTVLFFDEVGYRNSFDSLFLLCFIVSDRWVLGWFNRGQGRICYNTSNDPVPSTIYGPAWS